MIKNGFTLILFFIFISFSNLSNANETTGNDIMRMCLKTESVINGRANSIDSDIITCLARVDGFKDGLLIHQLIYNKNKKLKKGVCFPDGVSTLQLVSVLVKWLENNPKNRNKAANIEMFFAFQDAYPCL